MLKLLKKLVVLLPLLMGHSAFALLSTPVMNYPLNLATSIPTTVNLFSYNSPGATEYEFKIGTNATLSLTPAQFSTSNMFIATNLNFGTVYYWQVRAVKSTFPIDSSNWSSIWSFTTISNVTTISPLNGATQIEPDVSLNWNYSDGIIKFEVQYDIVNTFNSPSLVSTSTGTGTNLNTSNLFFGTNYYWRVRGMNFVDTSQWSSVMTFTTINSITLLSPSSGATNVIPNNALIWDAISGVTNYQVQYDKSTSFNSPDLHSSVVGNVSQINTTAIYFNTYYFWRVRAIHATDTSAWSSIWNFKTVTGVVTLQFPWDSATNLSTNPDVYWNSLNGIYNYEIQFDTSSLFNSSALSSVINSYVNHVVLPDLYFANNYYWRVRSINSVDSSAWSAPWTFSTQFFLSNRSPGSNNTDVEPNPKFEWLALSGNIDYQIQYDTTSSFNSPILSSYLSGGIAEYQSSHLLFNARYYWRHRAFNNIDTSNWSMTTHFNTIDTMEFQYPVNGDTTIRGRAVFDWSNCPCYNVQNFEIQYDTVVTFNSNAFTSLTAMGTANTKSSLDLYSGTKYYWRMRAFYTTDTTRWSGVWTFKTISKVSLTDPVQGGSINSTGVLDWYSFYSGPSNFYQYQYDTAYAFNSSILGSKIISSIYDKDTVKNLYFDKPYYWRVRYINSIDTTIWSDIRTFYVYSRVYANTPTNGAINISINPIIKWSTLKGSIGYQYRYAADSNLIASSPIVNSIPIQDTLYNLNYGTDYYWQIRAYHILDTTNWCPAYTFRTIFQLTTAPTLLSPINSAFNISPANTLLQWNSVVGISNYEFQIADNSGFVNSISGFSSNLYTHLSTLQTNTIYYWRVRAVNSVGNSPWSNSYYFMTAATVNLNEVESEVDFKIMPNPTSSSIEVICPKLISQSTKFNIIDVTGKLILEGQLLGERTRIDLEPFRNGIYFIVFENGKRQKIVKI